MHNSNYDLKYVLPTVAQLQRNGAIDDVWVEDSFSCKIIPKSSEKLLVLEFMWKHVVKTRIIDDRNCTSFTIISPYY